MDYRVIDSLYHKLETLRLNTEYRHKYIAALNAKREAEAQKAGEPNPPKLTHNILADARIQEYTKEVAKEVRTVLLEALSIVEDGKPLPPFVREFVAFLCNSAPDLSFHPASSMIWESQAGQFLPRIAPYLAQESAKPAGIDNTPAAEKEPPRAPLCIPTAKSRSDLARIFHALVEAGYIAGDTPEALPDFLNSFATQDTPAQEPKPQGRITWVWTAKNKQVSPSQILDFATQVAGRGKAKLSAAEDGAFLAAVSAIFGVSISKSVLHRYNYPGNNGPETSATIARILDG